MSLLSMPTSVLLSACLLALASPLLVWAFTAQPGKARQQALHNLHQGFATGEAAAHDFQDSANFVLRLSRRLTPAGWARRLDRLLARAGRPAAWPLERVLVTKTVLSLSAGILAFLLVSSDLSPRSIAIAGAAVLATWALPDLLFYNIGIKRRSEIQKALPDSLDQLTIAVEAGLGFDAAMNHVARNGRGPLPDELMRTLQDIQVGQPRRQAYLALAERAQVPDLQRFVRAIVQADQHGVSIARVLSTQAHEMRLKRRMRAEESAMKIPVKVVFPLILFIMPTLFIVVLGPAAISMLEGFGGVQ
jgi:tight adherence protein C